MQTVMGICALILCLGAVIGILAAASDIQLILSAICFSGGTTALGLAGIMARLESRPPI